MVNGPSFFKPFFMTIRRICHSPIGRKPCPPFPLPSASPCPLPVFDQLANWTSWGSGNAMLGPADS